MFERFTDSARQTIFLAEEESRGLGHDRIDTEHLLLGLVREDTGPASLVLSSFGLTLADARSAVVAAVGASRPPSRERNPFTPRAQAVLRASLPESQALHHVYVGSGHLLLGLLVANDGRTAEFLTRLGISAEEARRRALAAIAAVPEAAPPGTTALPRSALDLALANARAGEIAAQLSRVKAEMDAAHVAGDGARVTAMHEREKALLAERAELMTEFLADSQTPPPCASPE
ncbi:Clp protease N-terminal domain-containing protein [Parafrankia sp. FMc2]|uniref:Clp protease N-terminal domain-containing protein n=1 Tax=Parafrankia sp. FMc2 TaxID=3233196 RepID=UPI0034D4F578